MRARKSPRLVSTAGAITLMTQAMMGAALGLIFGLALVLINPAVAALLKAGGSPTIFVFVITLVTSFAIGATLTGAVFVLMDDKET
ncbi:MULTISPECIES: hypothetical protein [unclassified Bradyrhizobium]|uniref:hypothetical protein n=1 Tax=unclassified Bradyrhizobium TaxID=2631580 RepID=UPI000489C7D0|nr:MULTISPECIES: hypothetical protein [unclassified Bradyrhizobium]MCP3459524.1 hypothetical protein [Bradyrhizobium sp. CCGUVB23]